MNIIDIILLVIVLAFALHGVLKGFLKSVLYFASSVISGILAKLFCSGAGMFVYNKFLFSGISDKISQIMPTGNVNGELQQIVDNALTQVPEGIVNAAKQFGFYPDTNAIFPAGVDITPAYVEEHLIRPIVAGIVTVICFVILFFVFSVFLRFVCYFIEKRLTDRENHKVINTTNRILGGLFGVLKGIIPAGIIAVVLNFIVSYIDNPAFIETVNNSQVCRFAAGLF